MKDLYSGHIKHSIIKLNNKKTDISVLKIGKRYNRGFLIEVTNGQKAPEKMFNIFVIRQMQVKAITTRHYIPTRVTKMRKRRQCQMLVRL